MRLSYQQAKELGILKRLPDDVARSVDNDYQNHKKSKGKASQINPQGLLFAALLPVIPEAVAEQKNLIPNRHFRADIYIPSVRLIVEVDGFIDHYRVKKICIKRLTDKTYLFYMVIRCFVIIRLEFLKMLILLLMKFRPLLKE